MKKCLYIILVIVILASCGESPEDYNKRAFAVSDSIIKSCDLNFEIASSKQETWLRGIQDNKYKHPMTGVYSSSYYVTWQEALDMFDKDMELFFELCKVKKQQSDSLYSTIKEYPEKSQSVFDNIKELMNILELSYNAAVNTEGSYKSFSSNLNDLYQNYKELKSKIEIEKK
jgi:hypothetical protein